MSEQSLAPAGPNGHQEHLPPGPPVNPGIHGSKDLGSQVPWLLRVFGVTGPLGLKFQSLGLELGEPGNASGGRKPDTVGLRAWSCLISPEAFSKETMK